MADVSARFHQSLALLSRWEVPFVSRLDLFGGSNTWPKNLHVLGEWYERGLEEKSSDELGRHKDVFESIWTFAGYFISMFCLAATKMVATFKTQASQETVLRLMLRSKRQGRQGSKSSVGSLNMGAET